MNQLEIWKVLGKIPLIRLEIAAQISLRETRMRLHTTILVTFVVLAAATKASILCGAKPEARKAEEDAVYAQLSELGQEYQRLSEEYNRAVPPDGPDVADMSLTDEKWLAEDREIRSRAPDPALLLPRFITLAEKHPDSAYSLDSLAFAMRRGGFDWQMIEKAIGLVLRDHLDDSRVIHVFDRLSGEIPTKKAETLLRYAYENSSDKNIRAAAGLSLAGYFHNLGKLHRRSRDIEKKAQLLNHDRSWKLVVTPYLEKNFPYDRDKMPAEVEQLLMDVIENYSDIEATDWNTSGPGRVFLLTEAFVHPKTYGDLAKSVLYELNSIVPGKKTPDIKGSDAAGNSFHLSNYEGKVVLLTFSANWCGGCVALYPLQRKLVDKFRNKPFVLLSVSQDKRIDTLQSSLKSGAITWRCWWDGLDGPIRNTWNCQGVPAIILLDDQHVIQDVILNRWTREEEFEKAISGLLNQISQKKVLSQRK